MKKIISGLIGGVSILLIIQSANAASLIQVYQQALKSDPAYKSAYAKEMSTAESVPQALSALLPVLNFNTGANWARTLTQTNTSYSHVRSKTGDLDLNLTQSIFNYGNWMALASAKNSVKAASATYNAAAQDLINRVAQAYFNVLQSEDVLRYTKAEKRSLYKEYVQSKQQFKVGMATITDVYNAKAAYDQSISDMVTAKNDLADKKEDLRSITGVTYRTLAPLKTRIPLVVPNPSSADQWVKTAGRHNWTFIAAKYTTLSKHDAIDQARNGHYPTVSLKADYDHSFQRKFSGNGYTRTKGPSAELDLDVPIFEGGKVNSQVRQAIANYEKAANDQEKTYRQAENDTRKSYLGILAGIASIKANKQTIVSNRSSLKGTKVGYKVGTRTMVDVLSAEETLYKSKTDYAKSRYSYILNIIALKEAAGTLNDKDIQSLNTWLLSFQPKRKKTITHRKK